MLLLVWDEGKPGCDKFFCILFLCTFGVFLIFLVFLFCFFCFLSSVFLFFLYIAFLLCLLACASVYLIETKEEYDLWE